jgi:hypothetical protein
MMIAGEYMDTQEIIASIDDQIAKLQHAKALLDGTSVKKSVGRPKKVAPVTKSAKVAKRVMSAEGKAKIAEAQRRRWAKSKKASNKAT